MSCNYEIKREVNSKRKVRYCGEPDYPIKWCSCVNNIDFWEIYEGNGLMDYIQLGNSIRVDDFEDHRNENFTNTNCQYCGGLGWVKCAEYDKERVI